MLLVIKDLLNSYKENNPTGPKKAGGGGLSGEGEWPGGSRKSSMQRKRLKGSSGTAQTGPPCSQALAIRTSHTLTLQACPIEDHAE